MNYDQRIEALLAKGKISSEGAAALKKSLQDKPAAALGETLHEPFPPRYLVAGGVAIGVLLVMGLAMTGGESSSAQVVQDVSEILNQSGKVGEMNKSFSSIISLVLIGLPVLGSLVWFALSYNGLVSKEENVLASWAQVESNYQRRADLIPNLVSSVRAYIEHEGQTMTDIAKLRAQVDDVVAGNAQVQDLGKDAVTKLDDEAYMISLAKAQQGLGGQLRNLMVSVEAYPSLKSSDQFLQLQAQLEGTENRINVARMAFNESVGTFNTAIRKMPGSLIAGMGNFQRKAYFKADEGAAQAPAVSFNEEEKAAE
ncbi:MAG: LemA family protein [Micavibrio sp.]